MKLQGGRNQKKCLLDQEYKESSLYSLLSAFLSPPTSIMPKESQCRGNRCSLKKASRTTEHDLRYHSPQPVMFASCWDGQLVTIKRTGRFNDFHCSHPDCTSSTTLRSSCNAHHRACKYLSGQYNGIKIECTVSSASSTVSPQTAVAGSSSISPSDQPDQEARSQGEETCTEVQSVASEQSMAHSANTWSISVEVSLDRNLATIPETILQSLAAKVEKSIDGYMKRMEEVFATALEVQNRQFEAHISSYRQQMQLLRETAVSESLKATTVSLNPVTNHRISQTQSIVSRLEAQLALPLCIETSTPSRWIDESWR